MLGIDFDHIFVKFQYILCVYQVIQWISLLQWRTRKSKHCSSFKPAICYSSQMEQALLRVLTADAHSSRKKISKLKRKLARERREKWKLQQKKTNFEVNVAKVFNGDQLVKWFVQQASYHGSFTTQNARNFLKF